MAENKKKASNGSSSANKKRKVANNNLDDAVELEKAFTPFQKKVYAAARKIPVGKVTTYKDLARFIGCPCTQAVGQALKRNPFGANHCNLTCDDDDESKYDYKVMVPCHRIVSSDLTIGGYSGATDPKSTQICTKTTVLAKEGVTIVQKHGTYCVEPKDVYRYEKD